MNHVLYDILRGWETASADEVYYVKKTLMPEDNLEHMTFKVTCHPNVKPCGEVYIHWFDIEVYDDGRFLGYIGIWPTESDIVYNFA